MNNMWQCIECGAKLGDVMGGEFTPGEDVPQKNIHTRGPNLVVTCPHCGAIKTWYTSDPIVKATYQLVEAVTTQMAKRLIHQVSVGTLPPKTPQI
jgi:uncharacterized Zn finger protein